MTRFKITYLVDKEEKTFNYEANWDDVIYAMSPDGYGRRYFLKIELELNVIAEN